MKEFNLGVDDTDSNMKMCTTYLGTNFVDKLLEHGVLFLDFPKLIRLNPNIPYKTRGNGAVALKFMCEETKLDGIWQDLISLIHEYSDIEAEKTHPGMVLLEGNPSVYFQNLYSQALYDLISLDNVMRELKNNNSVRIYYLKKGRGLIGASSAIGANLSGDYTYELITYRSQDNYGISERIIDNNSVMEGDRNTPLTFNNVDYVNRDIMIIPHGPDPIYCGVRGETVDSVINMWKYLKIGEPIEKIMIFRTNQHTKAHFPKLFSSHEIKPYCSVMAKGTVVKNPYYISGGHVIFQLQIDDAVFDCAAYEPTKQFRKIILSLTEKDEILVFGGIRKPEKDHRLTFNLEEIQILHMNPLFNRIPPKCPRCHKTLKSAGKSAGFKCKKCDYRTKTKNYLVYQKPRGLKTGIRYVTPVCAQRHLTKPVVRDIGLQFNIEKPTNFKDMFLEFLQIRQTLTQKEPEKTLNLQ
jgi:tRNA(Ile2)-agmatinylcytidine synthase